jgi:plasmid stability protein
VATLTVRDVPDEVRDKLRIRAAENGRSMEAEVREVLSLAVASPRAADVAEKDHRSRVRRLQELMRPYRSKDRSIVDEFLAERRAVWGED